MGTPGGRSLPVEVGVSPPFSVRPVVVPGAAYGDVSGARKTKKWLLNGVTPHSGRISQAKPRSRNGAMISSALP